MTGLGESILLEGETRGIEIGEIRGIKIGEARGIEIGEARGIRIGEIRGVNKGVVLSAEVFKAIRAGECDNAVIARQCGCAVEDVERIRNEFGI